VLNVDEISLYKKKEIGQIIYDYVSIIQYYVISSIPTAPHSTVKNLVAKFRTGHLSSECVEFCGRPTEVIIPQHVNVIYFINLDDQRITTKKIAETLAISRVRLCYIMYEILDVSAQPNGFPDVSMLLISVIECLLHKPFWTDFGGILLDFCVTMEETWILINNRDTKEQTKERRQ
jgi:hypothetical protein